MAFSSSGAYVPAAGDPESWLRANDCLLGRPSIDGAYRQRRDRPRRPQRGGCLRGRCRGLGSTSRPSRTPPGAAMTRTSVHSCATLRTVVEVLGFDTSRPPFEVPGVRRAVSMAVDWSRLAATRAGRRRSPPSCRRASRPRGWAAPYDPEAARAELAAAGYPGGEGFPAVPLATYGNRPRAAIALELERELGIDVAVEERSFGDQFGHARRGEHARPLERWPGAPDYPHAHDSSDSCARRQLGQRRGLGQRCLRRPHRRGGAPTLPSRSAPSRPRPSSGTRRLSSRSATAIRGRSAVKDSAVPPSPASACSTWRGDREASCRHELAGGCRPASAWCCCSPGLPRRPPGRSDALRLRRAPAGSSARP